MKRLVLVLAVLFTAATLFAGDGKHCDMNKAAAKKVALTGTVVCSDGDCEKAVFRVANSDQTFDVCGKSKTSLKQLSADGAVKVKGQLVNCSESDGQELVIEEAKKI